MEACKENLENSLTSKEFFGLMKRKNRNFLLCLVNTFHGKNLSLSAVAPWMGAGDPEGVGSIFEKGKSYTYSGGDIHLEVSGEPSLFLKAIRELTKQDIDYPLKDIHSMGVYDVKERKTDPLKGDELDFSLNPSFHVYVHFHGPVYAVGRRIPL